MSDLKERFDLDKNDRTSDFYKLVEGQNRLRIMTDFVRVDTLQEGKTYKGIFNGDESEAKKLIAAGPKGEDGKPIRRINTRGWAWAIVRSKDGDEAKIVQFGKTILGSIAALQTSEEWGYEGYPMDYDIVVDAKNAGTTDVIYTVMPMRPVPVKQEETELVATKRPIEEIITAIVNKQDGVEKEAKVDKEFDSMGSAAFKGKDYPENDGGPVGL